MIRTHRTVVLLASAALAVPLGACKIDNRPFLARNAPPPQYGLPQPGPLDPAEQAHPAAAAGLEPAAAYAYPQRAYATRRAFRAAPPAYAFAYGGEEPWVWQAADQGLMFAEPYGGGYRYYYYEPGQAGPYFVQAPDYGYAYGADGALLALFDAAGVLLSGAAYGPQRVYADQYWRRAGALNRAYWASPRYAVGETAWRERAPRVWAAQDRWFDRAQAQPLWRAEGRHDNGLHRGWYKDRGREVAVAAPAPAAVVERSARIAEPGGRGWRDEGRSAHATAHAERQAARGDQGHGPGNGSGNGSGNGNGGGHGQGGGKHGGANEGGGNEGGGKHGGGDKHGHGKP